MNLTRELAKECLQDRLDTIDPRKMLGTIETNEVETNLNEGEGELYGNGDEIYVDEDIENENLSPNMAGGAKTKRATYIMPKCRKRTFLSCCRCKSYVCRDPDYVKCVDN